MIVHYKIGIFNEGNPLTIADMGAYLIIMSVCNLMLRSPVDPGWGAGRLLIGAFSWLGIGLGLWLTFNTSRGETFTGIACACLLVALVKGKTIGHQLTWMAGLMSVLAISIAIVFLFLLPKRSVSELSWRYSQNAIAEGSNARIDLTTKSIEIALSSPKNFLFGIGARGCEKRLGMYPHNHFVQAFAEMGIIGLGLLCAACLFTFTFGFRTLSMARRQGDLHSLVFTAFILALFIYELVVLSKKGSLTFVDTSMWLGIAVFSFDRTSVLIDDTGTAEHNVEDTEELGVS
jgi:O-antigen ligase